MWYHICNNHKQITEISKTNWHILSDMDILEWINDDILNSTSWYGKSIDIDYEY